jgi:hypothetical protein
MPKREGKMKNRSIFSFIVLIFAVFSFFTTCGNPNKDDSVPYEDPNKPNLAPTYTVSFEANGGSPAPQSQTISQGGKVTEPTVMGKNGQGFGGWYKEAAYINQWNFATNIVTGNTILYAKWVPPVAVPGASFFEKMRWLDSNVQSGGFYIVEVNANESTGSITLSYRGKNYITIALIGTGPGQVITLATDASMFTIESGITLILDDKIELRGSRTFLPLVKVNSGGGLILNNGTRIIGQISGDGVSVDGTFTMNGGEISGNGSGDGSGNGRGVSVLRGTFTMNGGKISGNIASVEGGGVRVGYNGIFTMNGGEISGNRGSGSDVTGITSYTGGGVFVYENGMFTMNDGKISDNSASSSGGGVYVYEKGTFSMNGGEISGNITSFSGGGVYVYEKGTFIMNGGKISSNNASLSGGGVCVNGIFTMNSGEISGNDSDNGGGVSVFRDTFIIKGGEISGNTAASFGGGVYVSGGILNKTGGTIFGYSDGDSDSNVVKNSPEVVQGNRGHAIHVNHPNSIYIKGKDTTSGPEDNLSITYNGAISPPSYSGEWDY